ncbi:cytokine receptor family member B12 precursor [Danio rerio]|uniref:Cytokine receptor family member B12 n=1 Tax=Danio rerio TaxID=7955 RepID=Q1RM05_DANRE|nr:cytokine receptor family member B12 precursor [Danio rerio]AAI15201.1 Cytokine receptor family member B12 [Danio rerio]|eukprot:NP_001035443.1 cytokine receptor family member B12 precursor [Danio rerio]
MTGFLTCMFTLLLICLIPCKATLSPPEVLTVGLLDFKATAEWLPGQGNPPGTRYTLEFIHAQNMSGGKWIGSPKCTDIGLLKCELNFDKPPFDLHWNYFLRVKATFKGTSSNWTTTTSSFQPYGDTRLSPPDVKISTDQKSIQINFNHWLESNTRTKPLDYLLSLFENSPAGETKFVAVISTSKSPYVFHDVPSGKNYCISVSASHHQASKNNNFNTTKCIFLLDSTRGVVLIVGIVAVLVIMFLAGIFLFFVCFNHIKPNIKKLRVPSALLNVSKPCRVLPLIPEAFQTIYQTLTWPKTNMNPEERELASDDDSNNEYLERGNFADNSYSVTNINLPEEAKTSNKYTLATNMEQSDGSGLSKMDNDSMHSGTSESCRSRSSKKIQMSIIDTQEEYRLETVFLEETLSCASIINDERELPDEQKVNEEDMDHEDYDSASEDDFKDEYIQRENFTIDPYFIASLNPLDEAKISNPYTIAADLEQSDGSGLSEINMHSESCTSKHSSSSEKLRTSIMDTLEKYEMEICFPEETPSCSSRDNYERDLPDEEKENEEEMNVLLPENVLEGGYEPRHNNKYEV